MRTLWVIVLLLQVIGNAQTPSGEIAGIVRDSTSAVVPDAGVTAVNQNTGETKTVRTNHSGEYLFPQVATGYYKLSVRRTGFRTSERQGVELSALQNLRIDFNLEVGQ